MEVLSATLCGAQALAYTLSVLKSLVECHTALRYGRGLLCDEQANVGLLQEIIIQLSYRTTLDPYLSSLLHSINTTVNDILSLVKRQKRLQLVIILVIRRTEVNESFALLERKKNTLNLYLTTQNSVAIASLKTGNLPHSTQNLDMAHVRQDSTEVCVGTLSFFWLFFLKRLQDWAYDTTSESTRNSTNTNSPALLARKPQSSNSITPTSVTSANRTLAQGLEMAHHPQMNPEAFQKETIHDHVVANSSALLARQQQATGSTIPTFRTSGNRATGRGHQIIYAPMSQDIDVRHEKNEKHGKSTQIIGIVDRVLSLPQKEYKKEKDVHGKKRYQFYTKGNVAVGNAVQRIYAQEHPTSNITHDTNIAEDHVHQDIYKDQTADPPAIDSSESIPGTSRTSRPNRKKFNFTRRARF